MEGSVTVSNPSPQCARIEFSHPSSNSLPRALLRELAAQIDAVSRLPEVRVIVLESAGVGAFCAGASFDELLKIKTVSEGEAFFSGFAEVILALSRVPQVTVARVHGKAAGGGVGLACATDYTLAVGSAAVRLSELALGIGPFTIGPVVQRRIGAAAFTELALCAEWRDAAWAERCGMFTEVFADIGALERRLLELTQRFASYPASATQRVKRMVNEDFTTNLEQLLAARVRAVSELVVTAEAQALIHAARKK